MARETMTVRIQPQTRKALDGIAASLDRDRTYVVNQALEAYIDIHQWQIDHIRRDFAKPTPESSPLRRK
jgi:predicted transcriptional regulator